MKHVPFSELAAKESELAPQIKAAVDAIRATGRKATRVPDVLMLGGGIYYIVVEMRLSARHKTTRHDVPLLATI